MESNLQIVEDTSEYNLSFKVVVIGDSNVGKSCLTGRAVNDKFDTQYSPTIGFEFLTLCVKIDNRIVKLQIWDTCGQEIYRSLIKSFYRNASLAMIVYSIDSKKSFNNINEWIKDIRMNCIPDVRIVLIGNKKDLEDKRQVSYEEAKRFKDENQLFYFEETSAKTGVNVKNVFCECARILYKEHFKYKNRAKNLNKEFYGSHDKAPKKLNKVSQKRKKGCC